MDQDSQRTVRVEVSRLYRAIAALTAPMMDMSAAEQALACIVAGATLLSASGYPEEVQEAIWAFGRAIVKLGSGKLDSAQTGQRRTRAVKRARRKGGDAK